MKRMIQTQIELDSQKLETTTDVKFQNIILFSSLMIVNTFYMMDKMRLAHSMSISIKKNLEFCPIPIKLK
ncbi:hypothetical protein LCGC14_2720770 [marine sediment metagenome]|uniref:Uncharacterized protein n=1 Tax=marine sediment metagenome TaxID=412755 RepID=A0A0F8ZA22_9ZZZZ